MAACFKYMPPDTEGRLFHAEMALKADDFGHRGPLKRLRRYRICPLNFFYSYFASPEKED